MPQRTFKRKSNGTRTHNSESSTDESKKGSSPCSSPIENATESLNCINTVPNRVFIGGLSSTTDEWDIRSKFCKYGQVKFIKIIRDSMGASKGYGFITFATEQEAKGIIETAEVTIKGRKLNIGPALKRQINQFDSQSNEVSSVESLNEENIITQPKKSFPKRVVECQYGMYNGNSQYMFETTAYLDASTFMNTSENCNGNSQVNYLIPCPALVYMPQYPYVYPTEMAYSNANMLPLMTVPATCCLTPESK